ncbi:acyl-[acyl-carrier-protein] thioesterase [Geobacter sp. AOG1]|uniref:acyl-[acyl-carrier-protein] thioesterase n=1 Tax=Geobacter sp. AOG1 TaxID=1566346 RepID=UPI001CC72D55|nr:acyl-ACP thioesterase domain-containing protein [Geobacter sp. AOG1]GFE57189.1 acyl-ACP thioesterase [Geobacter sp. AOG1]
MNLPTDLIYEKQFRVRTYEVDLARKLRPTALLNYLQDVAGDHARQLGVSVGDLMAHNLTWVISRYHLLFVGDVGTGAVVRIRSWPSSREGLFSCREFEVLAADDTPLALATSSWAVVDLATRKPVRLADHLPDYPLLPRRVMDDDFGPLPRLKKAVSEMPFRVRRSDLDLNRHVNNVVYAEWALETVPPPVADGFRLAELEIAFRAEALYGDWVISRCAPAGEEANHCFVHQLVNEQDGRELTRLVSRWQAFPTDRGE